jgi:hypothetical protein
LLLLIISLRILLSCSSPYTSNKKNNYTYTKQYKKTINTSTRITKTPHKFQNTHTLQNPHIQLPTYYKLQQPHYKIHTKQTYSQYNKIPSINRHPNIHGNSFPKNLIATHFTSLEIKKKSLLIYQVSSNHNTILHITSLLYTQSPLEFTYL